MSIIFALICTLSLSFLGFTIKNFFGIREISLALQKLHKIY